MSDDTEIYQSTYEELQNTLENQLEAYRRLNQRAIDLTKINLIGISVIFTGVSVGSIPFNIPIISGFLSLSYSVWSCFKIYNPTKLHRGLGAESISDIDDLAKNGGDLAEHYRKMMYGFKHSVNKFTTYYPTEVNNMKSAIWASIASIIFFVIAGLKNILPTYPTGVDLVWLIIVPILALWGRYKYNHNVEEV